MQAPNQLSKMFKFIIINFITNLALCKSIITKKVTNNLLIIINKYSKDMKYIPCFKIINAPKLTRLFIAY